MTTCSHCGGEIVDQGETIHAACVGPALVERRRLRAEIAGRIYAALTPFAGHVPEAREPMFLARQSVAEADALLAALDEKPAGKTEDDGR